MIGLAVLGMLTSLGLGGVAVWIGKRFDADENTGPWGSADIETQPWPAPR